MEEDGIMVTPDMFDVTDQTAIVTGGTRGIGAAISKTLAESGADVVPTSRTKRDVENTVASVRERDSRSLVCPTDVTNQTAIEELFERVDEELGGVDIVVNNAGINPEGAMGHPETIDESSFDQTISVNLKGPFLCARTAAEYLSSNNGNTLINVASVSGIVGLPRQHPYVASKHGLVGLTKSLALDWAPDIRVNAVAPGYVRTELTADLQSNDRVRQSIVDRTPMTRLAEPEELGGPVLFLASDAASFVTGTILTVDGGWSAR